MNETLPATVSKDERNWAMLAHLSGLLSLTGLGALAAAFVIWLVRKDRNDFSSDQAREALNFQLTMFICFVVAAILKFILIGFLLIGLLVLVDVVFSIIAAVQASEGRPYRYPFSIRLVS